MSDIDEPVSKLKLLGLDKRFRESQVETNERLDKVEETIRQTQEDNQRSFKKMEKMLEQILSNRPKSFEDSKEREIDTISDLSKENNSKGKTATLSIPLQPNYPLGN